MNFEVETVDGAALLDRLRASLTRYVVLPDRHAEVAVTLWIAATHAQVAWEHAPRLAINSPERRCGKSRLLDVISETCRGPIASVNTTVPALFRSIDPDDPPTLIFDEADAIWSSRKNDGAEDLRALINAGHQRNRPVRRVVGPTHEVKEFSTFAMTALAGIGDCIPDTVTDRAVCVTMRRRAHGETVAAYRSRRDAGPLRDLRGEIGAWLRDEETVTLLQKAEPDMPVEDRAADTWEPLLAVAEQAGGHWPASARAACIAMAAEQEARVTESNLNTELLADIRATFTDKNVTEIATADLVHALITRTDTPWEHFDFNARKLAARLAPYGVRSRQIRIGGRQSQVRGYRLSDFIDAFRRYLPDRPNDGPEPPSQPVTPSHPQVKP